MAKRKQTPKRRPVVTTFERRLALIERAVRENTAAIRAERHDIGRVASALAMLKTSIEDLIADVEQLGKPGPATSLQITPGAVTKQ